MRWAGQSRKGITAILAHACCSAPASLQAPYSKPLFPELCDILNPPCNNAERDLVGDALHGGSFACNEVRMEYVPERVSVVFLISSARSAPSEMARRSIPSPRRIHHEPTAGEDEERGAKCIEVLHQLELFSPAIEFHNDYDCNYYVYN